MQTLTKEITEARYRELEAMTYAERHNALFPDGLPPAWEYGYGYYGHRLVQKGDRFMVQHKIGESCD